MPENFPISTTSNIAIRTFSLQPLPPFPLPHSALANGRNIFGQPRRIRLDTLFAGLRDTKLLPLTSKGRQKNESTPSNLYGSCNNSPPLEPSRIYITCSGRLSITLTIQLGSVKQASCPRKD